MRYVRTRIISLATIVLLAGTLVAFLIPYRTPSWQTELDRILPIDKPHTLTFTADGIVEQWQIAPLSSMASVLFIPNDINVATPALPNQRLFMVTRRIKESTSLSDVREFYARSDTGDFLLGQVRNGRVIAYAPRILVRPQQAINHAWNQFFTDGAGGITASQTIDSEGCRQISIRGRDITTWHETLCNDSVRAQNHDALDAQTALRKQTSTILGKNAVAALHPPALAQLDEASLIRIGNMQIHDNNEKVIAPLVVLQPQNLLLGTVTSGFLAATRISDGSYAWEYHVSGDIYGSPSIDPYSGDVILATTHKEVHRITVDGIRRWSTTLTDPIVADPCATPLGVVVADTAGNVSLLADQDGQPQWSFYVGANVVATPVFVPTQHAIVVASQSGSLTALSLEGTVIWQSENEEAVLADLRHHADALYVVGNEGSVSAYNVANGESMWVNAIDARTQWPIAVSQHGLAVATTKNVHLLNHDGTPRAIINEQVTAPPQFIADGVVLVSETQIMTANLDGIVQHSWAVAPMKAAHDSLLHSLTVATAPQFDTQSLYFADMNGRIFALSAQSSATPLTPHWYHNTISEPMNSGTVVQRTVDDAGNLVVASSTQQITVIDAQNGTILKQFLAASSAPPYAIATSTEHIYIAEKSQLTAYARTDGSVHWSQPLAALDQQHLIVAGDSLVHVYQLNATQAMVRVHNQKNGEIRWAFPYFSTPTQTTVHADSDAVYLNGIFSLAITDGTFRWFSEIPLVQHVATNSAWCGIITIQPDAYGCVDRNTGKTIDSSIHALPIGAQLSTHPQHDTIIISTPTHVWVKDAQRGELRWEQATSSPLQAAIVTANNTVALVYVDGRLSVHDAISGRTLAILHDAPFDYRFNSRYGTLLPLLAHKHMLFLVSNTHILAFDRSVSGDTP